MSRRRWIGAVFLSVLTVGCALPEHKDLDVVTKKAVTFAEANNLIDHFNQVRDAADSSGDPRLLREIEGGTVLELETSAIFARQELGHPTVPTQLDDASTVASPSFEKYPLWFVSVGALNGSAQQVAGVYVRDSSTAPWRLEFAPRLAASTEFPTLEVSGEGAAVPLSPTRRQGLPASPQTLVDRYVEVLADPSARYAEAFVPDEFLAAVRELHEGRSDEPVPDRQRWSVAPVDYVLRSADGGAVIFADVVRTDGFRVPGRHPLGWEDSEAAAYFSGPVRSTAKLTYAHQLLLSVPAEGKPVLIGQYGGLIDATGH